MPSSLVGAAARAISPPAAADTIRPLKDAFNRVHSYLRISLTERCSLRCIYCMPEAGIDLSPKPALLTTPELRRLTRVFAQRGITKIRLTGGEPLLRQDIVEIAEDIPPNISNLGITTNGIVLRRYAERLLNAGVTNYNISLDTLNERKFEILTRRKGLANVLGAIDTIGADARTDLLKINMVVMKGINDCEILDFVKKTEHSNIDVRFIEFMPFSENNWNNKYFMSYSDILASISREFPSLEKVPDDKNDTCKHYRVEGWRGKIGFISSMTEHFCGTCNRLRITADGALKVCLHGNEEVSLRDAMRDGMNDADINKLIDHALAKKHFKLGGSKDRHELAQSENRSMIRIGG